MLKFDDLSEEAQVRLLDATAEELSDLYWCNRAWEAWQVGTMTQADFVSVGEDDDIVRGVTVALFNKAVGEVVALLAEKIGTAP